MTFYKNLLQNLKDMEPQTYKKMYARGPLVQISL